MTVQETVKEVAAQCCEQIKSHLPEGATVVVPVVVFINSGVLQLRRELDLEREVAGS